MRIRVDDPAAQDELAAALVAAGCETRAGEDALEIVHPELPNDPFELRFFLRAWFARHPGTAFELLA